MLFFSAITPSKIVNLVADISVTSIESNLSLLFNSVLQVVAKRPIVFSHFSHVFIYILYLYADNSTPAIRTRIQEFLQVHEVPIIFQRLIENVPLRQFIHDSFILIRFTLPPSLINMVDSHLNSGFMLSEFIEVSRISKFHHIELGIFKVHSTFKTISNLLFTNDGSVPGLWSHFRETKIGIDTLNLTMFNLTLSDSDFQDYRLFLSLPYFIPKTQLQAFDLEILLTESLKWALFSSNGARRNIPRPHQNQQQIQPQQPLAAPPIAEQSVSPPSVQPIIVPNPQPENRDSNQQHDRPLNNSPFGQQRQRFRPRNHSGQPRRGLSMSSHHSHINSFIEGLKRLSADELDKFRLKFDPKQNKISIGHKNLRLNLLF